MAFQSFEIPSELRTLAERSVEEARKTFETFIEAAHTITENLEGATSKLNVETKDARSKAVSFAEENMRTAFAHAEKLVHAKTPDELLSLQLEFARNQVAAFQTQVKELGAAFQNLTKQGK